MPSRPRLAAAEAHKTTFKTWDQYVAEADRAPFEFPVSDTETLLIKCPDGAALRAIVEAQTAGDLGTLIDCTFGDQAPRAWELFATAPFPAMQALTKDVVDYFTQGDSGE